MRLSIAVALAACALGCSSSPPPRELAREEERAPPEAPAPPPELTPPPRVVLPAITRDCAVPRRPRVPIQEGIPFARGLALDLAVPEAGGPHPWVVLIHGGAWRAGERAHMHDDLATLAGLGYAAASVDYRLLDEAGENHFPAQIADVRCAVRLLRREAARFGLDPDRGAAMGYSAGAHLALLLGTAPDAEGLDAEGLDPPEACGDRVTSARVASVIAFFGPADLRADADYRPGAARIIERLLGGPRTERRALATLASPIAHVDPTDAPTLLAHGVGDAVVPVEQSRAMHAALRAAGVPVVYVEVEDAGHGFRLFPGRRSAGPRRDLAPTCTALAFLEATLRDAAPPR